jgi:hypothetical protein
LLLLVEAAAAVAMAQEVEVLVDTQPQQFL